MRRGDEETRREYAEPGRGGARLARGGGSAAAGGAQINHVVSRYSPPDGKYQEPEQRYINKMPMQLAWAWLCQTETGYSERSEFLSDRCQALPGTLLPGHYIGLPHKLSIFIGRWKCMQHSPIISHLISRDSTLTDQRFSIRLLRVQAAFTRLDVSKQGFPRQDSLHERQNRSGGSTPLTSWKKVLFICIYSTTS